MSAILLQHFLTGLQPPIRRQLLLHGKPETLQQAISATINVEFALNFDAAAEDTQDINDVQCKHPAQDTPAAHKLQESLDQILKRLETLEAVHKQPPAQVQQHLEAIQKQPPPQPQQQYARPHRNQPNRDQPR